MKIIKSLKLKNSPLISTVIILYTAFLITVSYLQNIENFSKQFVQMVSDLKAEDGIFAIIPILIYILTGFISGNYKAVLVFWKFRNPLPGSEAFSKYAEMDPRIDISKLQTDFSPYPKNAKEQNAVWYNLSKKYENSISVESAHKAYLLGRDITAISFLYSILGTLILLWQKTQFSGILIYFLAMSICFISFAVVAQNHGKRLVCNVLAEYTSDKGK